MPRACRSLSVLVLVAAVTLAGTTGAQALETHRCTAAQAGRAFDCATVAVPLDRTGRLPGTVALSIAVERPKPGATGFLLALSGGPGQGAVAFASSFRSSLAPALAHRRLVVVDQRGTGGSGALRCDALQRLGGLQAFNTRIVQACSDRLGPQRASYATTDTVEDLDAVRAALGAPKLELMGVSYGTYVAVQYARIHPDRVDGLILDSVVAPTGVDPYYLDTFTRLPRILREQCAHRACAYATTDPIADVGALTARLAAGHSIGARVPDGHGVLRSQTISDEGQLLLLMMNGDLNPYLQAALPGAIGAAAHGDAAPLARLRRIAAGPPTPVKDLSAGLNIATTCADLHLPYALTAAYPERYEAWRHGLDAVPDSAFAPFTRDGVLASSSVHDCLRWGEGDAPAAPSTAPLPDVPALLLSGRLDTRTPLENAQAMQALLPHARRLTVAGAGHDVLDGDLTGCAARALRRFAAGQPVGTPCAGRRDGIGVLARPARSLSAYRAWPGVPSVRGRELSATIDTVRDVEVSYLQALYAGFSGTAMGGLRGGHFTVTAGIRVRLYDDSLVPGLRVSGTLRLAQRAVGTLRVRLRGGPAGVLHLGPEGQITGTLGGRPVNTRAIGARAARAARAQSGRSVDAGGLAWWHAAVAHARAAAASGPTPSLS